MTFLEFLALYGAAIPAVSMFLIANMAKGATVALFVYLAMNR